MADAADNDLTSLTVDLLAAYLSSHSNVRPEDLPSLIASTHAALQGLAKPGEDPAETSLAEEHQPAVTARKSLANPDFIISMIDGKPYKTLKRHLGRHGLTPDQYRQRYNLPASYPMVAKGYSEQRRDVAKRLGLGRKGAAARAERAGEAGGGDKPASGRGRGRPKKSESDAAA